jgi:hypothetical protein
MKVSQALGSIALMIVLTTGAASLAESQPYSSAPPQTQAQAIPLDNGRALTDEEARAFDARLRAAGTDQVRAKITRERDDLIRSRLAQQSASSDIPARRPELSDDLIMLGVPTPPLQRSWQTTTLPGGAFAPMERGTNPYGRLETSAADPIPPRP